MPLNDHISWKKYLRVEQKATVRYPKTQFREYDLEMKTANPNLSMIHFVGLPPLWSDCKTLESYK